MYEVSRPATVLSTFHIFSMPFHWSDLPRLIAIQPWSSTLDERVFDVDGASAPLAHIFFHGTIEWFPGNKYGFMRRLERGTITFEIAIQVVGLREAGGEYPENLIADFKPCIFDINRYPVISPGSSEGDKISSGAKHAVCLLPLTNGWHIVIPPRSHKAIAIWWIGDAGMKSIVRKKG